MRRFAPPLVVRVFAVALFVPGSSSAQTMLVQGSAFTGVERTMLDPNGTVAGGTSSMTAHDDWAAVTALSPGVRVRVDTVDTVTVAGRVRTVGDAEIVLVTSTGPLSIQRHSVRRVVRVGRRDVGRSAKRGLLIGAAVGGTLGGVGAATFVESDKGRWFVALTAGWTALGGLAGALTALIHPTDQIVYERQR